MRISYLLPLLLLGLAGCVTNVPSPAPATAVITPAPTYVTPAAPSSTTTVVRTP